MYEPHQINPSSSTLSALPDKGRHIVGIDFERAYTVLIRAYLRHQVIQKEQKQGKEVTDE